MSKTWTITVALMGALAWTGESRAQGQYLAPPPGPGFMPPMANFAPPMPAMPPGMGPIPFAPPPLGMGPMGGMGGMGGPMSHGMHGGPNPFANQKEPPLVTFGMDYVFVWYQKMKMPFPTLTSGSATDTIPGALDQSGTTPLFQEQRLEEPHTSAVRLRFIAWIPDTDGLSLETNFLLAEQRSFIKSFSSNEDANLVLSRPYFNPASQTLEAFPVALPNLLNGSSVDVIQTRMMGWEGNARYNLSGNVAVEGLPSWSALVGARWLKIDEKYFNTDSITSLGSNNISIFQDNFTTYNNFMGGQFGFLVNWQWQLLAFELTTKVAVGINKQTVQVSGSSSFVDPVTGTIIQDNTIGSYVQPTNVGSESKSRLAAIPEIGLNVRYPLGDRIRFNLGYTGTYFTNMVRPSGQIDFNVNPQAIGAPPNEPLQPQRPTFHQQNFWIQSVNMGLEFVF